MMARQDGSTRGEQWMGVYLNFIKAFDTVSHNNLVALRKCGLDEWTVQ